jgi:hypothetical protein
MLATIRAESPLAAFQAVMLPMSEQMINSAGAGVAEGVGANRKSDDEKLRTTPVGSPPGMWTVCELGLSVVGAFLGELTSCAVLDPLLTTHIMGAEWVNAQGLESSGS